MKSSETPTNVYIRDRRFTDLNPITQKHIMERTLF